MEIKPKYITFKQAKLLKKREFDVSTLTVFDDDNGEVIASYSEDVFSPINYNTSSYKTSRPEQWQVVEWLLLKHNIYVVVRPAYNSVKTITKFGFDILGTNERRISNHPNFLYLLWNVFNLQPFDNIENAYNAAFDYILNNHLI